MKTILANYAREIWWSLSAEDACLDKVRREWQEEADLWQAKLTDQSVAEAAELAAEYLESGSAEFSREAVKWAVAAIHSSAWATEEERRKNEEFEAAVELAHHVAAAAEAIGKALRIEFSGRLFGSYYADFHGLKLRVSDHSQKPGGGYHEVYGRMGEADWSWIFRNPQKEIPSRESIRAEALELIIDRIGVTKRRANG